MTEGLVPAAISSKSSQLAAVTAGTELQVSERPLLAITSSSHCVPGGQLAFQPNLSGNDRVGAPPLERWDVEVAPSDTPTGMHSCWWLMVPGSYEH
jgi:hypothetical protein